MIVEKEVEAPEHVTVIKVEDTRYALALASAAYFGYPAEQLKVIGITGTKGKTTTTYMVKSILEGVGHKVGLIRNNRGYHRRRSDSGKEYDTGVVYDSPVFPENG